MLSSTLRAVAFPLCTVLSVTLAAAAQDTLKRAEKHEGLTPCLAVLADGSPVYPSDKFPPTTRITAAFRLPDDATAKKLNSKWVALGGEEKVLATNSLDLMGQKTGWLRLELKEPAAPGKYRIDTMLDDTPWKSADLEITPPIEEGKAEKPTDFLIVKDGASHAFDMVVRPAPGAPEPPQLGGMTKAPDGTYRAAIVISYDKPADASDDAGLRRTVTVNGKPASQMFVKLTESGLVSTKTIDESGTSTDVNPPKIVHPLPPSLTNNLQWKCPASSVQGANQDLVLFGPLTIPGPEGPATGYIIYGEEPVEGAPASGATGPSVQTMERHYIPRYGIVRENRAVLINGKLAARQELTLATAPYRLVADSNMKGRLGRVQFAYPKDTETADAKIAIYKAGATPDDKAMSTGYGDKSFDVMPGRYEASVNGKRVPIEVKSGHVTTPHCGVLRVHASSDTHWRVLDPKDKSELTSGYGEDDIALPAGTYLLEISGASEQVTLADGQVVEF